MNKRKLQYIEEKHQEIIVYDSKVEYLIEPCILLHTFQDEETIVSEEIDTNLLQQIQKYGFLREYLFGKVSYSYKIEEKVYIYCAKDYIFSKPMHRDGSNISIQSDATSINVTGIIQHLESYKLFYLYLRYVFKVPKYLRRIMLYYLVQNDIKKDNMNDDEENLLNFSDGYSTFYLNVSGDYYTLNK